MNSETGSRDPLMQPFTLRHLELRNRIISTSHEPAFSKNGLPQDRYLAYHVEKARGGIAMTMIGGSAIVAKDSPPAFGNLELYRDEIVPHFQRLADAVHEHDTAIMCQITHLGRRTSNFTADWLPVLAPSSVKERAHRSQPKQAELWDIQRIIAEYAAAAARCQAGGLDGIELQAYGHLIDSFLSPAINRRDDEYGGSLENRLRFPLEVVRAVRQAVGPEFIVGLRLAVTDELEDGLSVEDGLASAKAMISEGVDFITVNRGNIASDQALLRTIPPMDSPSAPFLEFAGMVRRELGVPILHAGRIADVATARHAISAGLLDLVGMTRAHIADPHLVRKVKAGDEGRIRPCVGASYCLDAIYQDGSAKCIHNPATGRELELPQTPGHADHQRRAVVVGAGPAGLEAARTLAERGHQVTVLEASGAPGGQLSLAARSPQRRDLIGIVDWRVSECTTMGVDFRYNTYADADDVLALNPDIVIIATGGLPDTSDIPGNSLITDGWDVLSGSARARKSVLLYDDHGGHSSMDVARMLLTQGAELEYVTPERMLAPDLGGSNYPPYAKAFAEHDVRTTLLHELRSIAPSEDGRLRVELYSEYSEQTVERVVDQVFVEQPTIPNDELYWELLSGSTNQGEVDYSALLAGAPQKVERNLEGNYQLFRIGDAVTSRNTHAAILDAYRLCHVM